MRFWKATLLVLGTSLLPFCQAIQTCGRCSNSTPSEHPHQRHNESRTSTTKSYPFLPRTFWQYDNSQPLLSTLIYDVVAGSRQNYSNFANVLWESVEVRERLDDPSQNTTLIVYPDDVYHDAEIRTSCHLWLDAFEKHSMHECPWLQRLVKEAMYPFPIPEDTKVSNEWYPESNILWSRDDGGDCLYSNGLVEWIWSRQMAKNGEIWVIGKGRR